MMNRASRVDRGCLKHHTSRKVLSLVHAILRVLVLAPVLVTRALIARHLHYTYSEDTNE